MNAFVSRLATLMACSTSLIFAGCEHKDLCYDHSHNVEIEIRFNWDAAPDADPNTMVVNFFSLDGTHVASREFSSREGGKIRVEAGEYKLLFHNGEMESVKESMGDYHNYGLITKEEALLAPMSRFNENPPRPAVSVKEPVRAAAETVWAGTHEYVMIKRGEDGQIVDLYPDEATAHYTVEVINVENMRDNLDISAALTGLSERFNISNSSAVGQPVTMPFAIRRKNDTTLEAQFLTFGHCPDDNTVSHILTIYTSSKVCYNFDVTDQVHTAPDNRNIYIRVEGLKLPIDGQDVSPSVDGWEEVEDVAIKMQ